jgi:hypothetical protein
VSGLVAICALLSIGARVAEAKVLCVDTTPGNLADNLNVDASCEQGKAKIGEALEAAAALPGADSVLIGPGDFLLPSAPSGIEAHYNSATPGNTVVVRGDPSGGTHLTMGGTSGNEWGLAIQGPAGSRVEDLRLTIPANADTTSDWGVYLEGGIVGERLVVDGPSAYNAGGVTLSLGATLADSSVELAGEKTYNTAVVTGNGSATIRDSNLAAQYGLSGSGTAITVERSTIEPSWEGLKIDSGTLIIRDSVIDLGSYKGVTGVMIGNLNHGSSLMKATLDGDTIVGGGQNSTGLRVQADNGTETAEVTAGSTIIDGPEDAIELWADEGRSAKLAVSYSNYDPATVDVNDDLVSGGQEGSALLETNEITNFDPGFLDAAAGNLRLAPSSPLIDRGDPAAPEAGRLDRDGNSRAGGCPPRRDVGAYELTLSCEAPQEGTTTGSGSGAKPLPETGIRGKHRLFTASKRVKASFKLSSSLPGASFRCKVDRQAYRPCGAGFAVKLAHGRHKVRAQAIVAGKADPTPAVITVKVLWPAAS